MSFFDWILDIPTSYENNFRSKIIEIGKISVIEIEVLSIVKHAKTTQIRCLLVEFGQVCDFVFFHFKPYQIKIFHNGAKLFVKCIFEQKGSNLTALQPKVLSKVDEIKVKYTQKREKISSSQFLDQINQFGFDDGLVQNLYNIHFPNANFVNDFLVRKGLSFESLNALKFLESLNHFMKLSRKKFDFEAKKMFCGKWEEFAEKLPFELTNDQKKALDEISSDFISTKASKRIIAGDVGTGKTMIILASAFMAKGSRSLLLAPTAILANQIYDEACKYLGDTLRIAIFTSKQKPKEALVNFDFLIGTHALLYENLPEIDLLMVDEQHRFGINQRNQIERLHSDEDGKKPHFLQFSATPIPRTQAMIESSMVDFSFLKQTPFEKKISTKIITKTDFADLVKHINSQIEHKHQTIIVYPIVEENDDFEYASIEKGIVYWQKNFEKVYCTFGKDKNKEQAIEEFREFGNILIATTLIEVGISLPRLTTIVIVGAERMGLATLHQLRGRVSRNGLEGFCFLYTNKMQSIRLREFAKCKDGFEIAKLDLKLRKSGDILDGKSQSGDAFRFLDLAEDEEIVAQSKSHFEKYLLKGGIENLSY